MKIKVLISLFAIYLLSGCQLLPENARLQVYRVAVQQGNVVDIENIKKLEVGMTEEQVTYLLGQPITQNIFNKSRWDYVYYLKHHPNETKLEMLSIFFKEKKIVSMKKIIDKKNMMFDLSNKNFNEPEYSNESKVNIIKDEDIKIEAEKENIAE